MKQVESELIQYKKKNDGRAFRLRLLLHKNKYNFVLHNTPFGQLKPVQEITRERVP